MKKCGIYCILNIATGKRYIGQSIDVDKRRLGHFCDLASQRHHNTRLQFDFEAYGIDGFEFRVLEETLEAMLDLSERAWISYYDSTNAYRGYNVEAGGNLYKHLPRGVVLKMLATRKSRPLTEKQLAHLKALGIARRGIPRSKEACQKMSAAWLHRKPMTALTKQKMSEARKGRVLSAETRRKISLAHAGKIKTPEHLRYISEALRNSPKARASAQRTGLARRGTHHSEATRRHLSEIQKTSEKCIAARKKMHVARAAKKKDLKN